MMDDVPSTSAAAAAASSSSSSSSAAASSAPSGSSRYTYCVTAQPPTLVSHTAVGAFTGPNERNLLLVRGSRLELYRVDEAAEGGAGLESLVHVPLYARVSSIALFRAAHEQTDRLLVLTERHRFFVCRWDARTRSIDTLATGDSKLKIGRVSDQGCLASVDPSRAVIGLHQYDSILQVIGIEAEGRLAAQIHECKLEQLQVLQMAWLHKQNKPTLIVLCVDGNAGSSAQRRVRSYTYEAKEKELRPASHAINIDRCEAGAAHVIATEFGGALIVAEEMISYVPTTGHSAVHLAVTPFVCTAVCAIDPSRYLLGDIEGGLHCLVLSTSPVSAGQDKLSATVTALKLEWLGCTSIAHRIQYIDAGLVMIGSIYGDSQLIRLSQTPVPEEDEEGQEPQESKDDAPADMELEGVAASSSSAAAAAPVTPKRLNFITIVHTFPHLGPIVDFAMLDLERNGQGAMLTCSGAYKDGSLRVVRNGIGVREEADIELAGIQGVWSLKQSPANEFHKMLVQTFATETRILALEPSEDEADAGELALAECEVPGFDATQRTLFCANVGEFLLQVTQNSCRLVDTQSLQLVDEWRIPAASAAASSSGKITVASANRSQVLLASGRLLLLLVLDGRRLRLERQLTLDEEISCLDCTPLGGSSAVTASFVAVCMWRDNSVRVLRASTLEEVSREKLGETVARSVLFAQFEGDDAANASSYLMCGLGDGNLISFELAPANAALSGRKKLAIGTSGIELRAFQTKDGPHVFASCDRPTVISSAHGRLLYSNVNCKSVSHMAPFHAEVFPDCLSLVSGSRLIIGRMDAIQKLHIGKIKTGGQPRRLALHAGSKTVAVVVVEQAPLNQAGNLTGETHKIKLFEADGFSKVHEIELQLNETALSIASLRLNVHATVASGSSSSSPALPEYFVVGTAYLNPEEPEPTTGRILVLEVDSTSTGRAQLRIVSEQKIMGGAWTVDAIQGRIVAGVNARVVIYRCVGASSSSASAASSGFHLEKECDYPGNIMVLSVIASRDGQYVMVGDMMRSMCILHYKSISNAGSAQGSKSAGSLEEVVRDYDSAWLTAMASFSPNDDVVIMADHHFNLVTLRRPIEAVAEEERARMEVVGKWHSGEMINKIAAGSLIMQLPPDPADAIASAAAASASSASASATSSSLSSFDRVVPTHLYGTISGSIGVLAPLSASSYKFFARLEEQLERVLHGVGNLSHKEWRAFHNERRTDDAMGFIDGDCIEAYVDLPLDKQEQIAAALGLRHAEVVKRVEDVSRIH